MKRESFITARITNTDKKKLQAIADRLGWTRSKLVEWFLRYCLTAEKLPR